MPAGVTFSSSWQENPGIVTPLQGARESPDLRLISPGQSTWPPFYDEAVHQVRMSLKEDDWKRVPRLDSKIQWNVIHDGFAIFDYCHLWLLSLYDHFSSFFFLLGKVTNDTTTSRSCVYFWIYERSLRQS